MKPKLLSLAESFGMKPFPDEPEKHFEARVMSVKEAVDKRTHPWRRENKQ